MVKKFISKLLKKTKYKAEVYISDDDFTAEYFSDSLNEVLSWTLTGIGESYVTSKNTSTMTRGVYGKICKFSLFHVQGGRIKVFEYKSPQPSDYLFMTDAMVYVPDSIMHEVKKEHIPIDLLK